MAAHLGHDKHEPVANAVGNTRNGTSRKTIKGEFGELPIEITRDRQGSFEPQLIPKHQTRWTGFDDKILSMYARGMIVREIQGHLEEMYGTEVFPNLTVTISLKSWKFANPCSFKCGLRFFALSTNISKYPSAAGTGARP